MGLSAKLSEMRMQDPVEGTARVVTIDYPHGADYEDARRYVRLDCVVSGPGIDPVAIEHKCTVAKSKVPAPKAVLPVLIDRANPKRIVIHWDKVDSPDLSRKDERMANRQKAEELAAEMRNRPGSAATGRDARHDSVDPATQKARVKAREAQRQYRTAHPKATLREAIQAGSEAASAPAGGASDFGKSGTEPAQRATGPGGEGEKLHLLQRLAKLHADGALTDAEFAAEKTRLLSS